MHDVLGKQLCVPQGKMAISQRSCFWFKPVSQNMQANTLATGLEYTPQVVNNLLNHRPTYLFLLLNIITAKHMLRTIITNMMVTFDTLIIGQDINDS